MVDWLPRSYAFMEAWCLALFLWAMACKENPEPISMVSGIYSVLAPRLSELIFFTAPGARAIFLHSNVLYSHI